MYRFKAQICCLFDLDPRATLSFLKLWCLLLAFADATSVSTSTSISIAVSASATSNSAPRPCPFYPIFGEKDFYRVHLQPDHTFEAHFAAIGIDGSKVREIHYHYPAYIVMGEMSRVADISGNTWYEARINPKFVHERIRLGPGVMLVEQDPYQHEVWNDDIRGESFQMIGSANGHGARMDHVTPSISASNFVHNSPDDVRIPCPFHQQDPDRLVENSYTVRLKANHSLEAHLERVGVDLSLQRNFSHRPIEYTRNNLSEYILGRYSSIIDAETLHQRVRMDPGVESVEQHSYWDSDDYELDLATPIGCAGINDEARCVPPNTICKPRVITIEGLLSKAEQDDRWARAPACRPWKRSIGRVFGEFGLLSDSPEGYGVVIDPTSSSIPASPENTRGPCPFEPAPPGREINSYLVQLKQHHTLEAHLSFVGIDLTLRENFRYRPFRQELYDDVEEEEREESARMFLARYLAPFSDADTLHDRVRMDPGVGFVEQDSVWMTEDEWEFNWGDAIDCRVENINNEARCVLPSTICKLEVVDLGGLLNKAEREARWARQPACSKY